MRKKIIFFSFSFHINAELILCGSDFCKEACSKLYFSSDKNIFFLCYNLLSCECCNLE